MANIVEQLQGMQGFHELPEERQHVLIRDALEAAVTRGEEKLVASTDTATVLPMSPWEAAKSFFRGEQNVLPSVNSVTPASTLQAGQTPDAPASTDPSTVLPMSPGQAATSYIHGGQPGAAPLAPAVGSALGAAVGGPLGEVAGTTAGYGANVAMGYQPFSLKEALTTIGPSVVFNARGIGQQAKSVLAPFARSSQMGQQAANSVVELQNAKLGADYDYSVASQAKAKAQMQLDYEQQVGSWNTLKAAQVTAKRQAAEDARQLTATIKSRNVTDAADWAANRPGVPTAEDVTTAYAAADTLAKAHTTPLSLPEVTAVKKTILTQADTLAKQPGGAPKARILRRLATSGQEDGITLTEANDIIQGLHQDIVALRAQPSRYAYTEADAYSKIVNAYEVGMTRLENDKTIPEAVRRTVKAANTLDLRYRTDRELTEFMTKDMVSPGPSGQPQLDPRAALKALDSTANGRMVERMQKVKPSDGDGKNLYEMTKDTLTQMAESGVKEQEAARLLRSTGGMVVPPKPVNPLPSQHALPYPEPQGGLTSALGTLGLRAAGAGAGFALGGGTGNPFLSVPSAAAGIGAPEIFAKLMQTGWGQRTLLSLVHHHGTTISPALVGLATAAVKAGESGSPPAAPGAP